MSDLLRRLNQDGAIGLDLSPGNQTAREAAAEIVALRAEVERLERLLREGHELVQDCISTKTAAEAALTKLRGKVEALIAEWRRPGPFSGYDPVEQYQAAENDCADQLAAILAEPKP